MLAKIKILAIAPYDALKTTILNTAEKRNDAIVDVYVGNMSEGVNIAHFHANDNYDVIISRGATAKLIEETVNIPVISVDFSPYDILRSMKLAENFTKLYAIVGFPSITKIARVLCTLLQKNAEIITIYHEEDAKNVIKDLKRRGFSTVICGTIGDNYAKEAGLSSIFITSGEESVDDALDQAIRLSRGYADMREKNLIFEKILENNSESIVLYDQYKRLYFSSLIKEFDHKLELFLKDEIDNLTEDGSEQIHMINNSLYTVIGKKFIISGTNYYLFKISAAKLPAQQSHYGIFFSDVNHAKNHFYNSFYGSSGALGKLESEINSIIASPAPVMIIGEEGSGKGQIALYIYINSLLCNRTLITIDCQLINEKSWIFLMSDTSSPFNEANRTYYLKNIDELSEVKFRQLCSVMLERNLHKQNRILLSCIKNRERNFSKRVVYFVNLFSCITLYLPSLRDRLEEIPILSSLYIGKRNLVLGKQIIGFEPEAMEILQNYKWPYNYTQLKRILDELTAATNTPYISTRHVKNLISQEATLSIDDGISFNFNRTLEEITKDIIHHELMQMGGNQSETAKKLGISRSTLWRYLKKQ